MTGIIPALAGNTKHHETTDEDSQDHPRSRGEYVVLGASVGPDRGSSPLSRGIRSARDRRKRGIGIIPALAGNTHGEGDFYFVVGGSSPLSRGIRGLHASRVRHGGIIPALAGNTRTREAKPFQRRDHPRSRGEYRIPARYQHLVKGSSPLSRGIPADPCSQTAP